MSTFYSFALDYKLCIANHEDRPSEVFAGTIFKTFAGFEVVQYVKVLGAPQVQILSEAQRIVSKSTRFEGFLLPPVNPDVCEHGQPWCSCSNRLPRHGLGCLECHREIRRGKRNTHVHLD